MSTLTVITAPTLEPVTVEELKKALRIDFGDDDARLRALIKSARQWAEHYTNLHIMSQVVERTYEGWPGYEFPLDVWPIQSIDTVAYYDTASPSVEQTLTVNTDYYADSTTVGGKLRTIGGWPSVAVRPNAIRVRMTAGYSSADNVDPVIKEGIKAYCLHLYDMLPIATAENILWPAKHWI